MVTEKLMAHDGEWFSGLVVIILRKLNKPSTLRTQDLPQMTEWGKKRSNIISHCRNCLAHYNAWKLEANVILKAIPELAI
jgi:hypothetical protein